MAAMLARLPRPLAVLFALAFVLAAGWCLIAPSQRASAAATGQYTDMQLLHDITDRVAAGTPYVRAAVETQRAHGYPTRPFVTVREPGLYVLAARIGWPAMQALAAALLAANLMAWTAALPATLRPAERIGAVAGIAFGGLAVSSTWLMAMSELWCGLLVSLALALTLARRGPWWAPHLAIAAALALRELALPFALLAMTFALWERRWKALAAWGAVLALFALGLALHAAVVAAEVHPGDITSPGWSGGLGLRGVLMAITYTSALQRLWQPLAMVLALLPLLGWLSLTGRGGLFVQALLLGYAALIGLFSRPDNFYWGFLLLPIWFAGWALVPRGAAQLWQAVIRPIR